MLPQTRNQTMVERVVVSENYIRTYVFVVRSGQNGIVDNGAD